MRYKFTITYRIRIYNNIKYFFDSSIIQKELPSENYILNATVNTKCAIIVHDE